MVREIAAGPMPPVGIVILVFALPIPVVIRSVAVVVPTLIAPPYVMIPIGSDFTMAPIRPTIGVIPPPNGAADTHRVVIHRGLGFAFGCATAGKEQDTDGNDAKDRGNRSHGCIRPWLGACQRHDAGLSVCGTNA